MILEIAKSCSRRTKSYDVLSSSSSTQEMQVCSAIPSGDPLIDDESQIHQRTSRDGGNSVYGYRETPFQVIII